MNRALLSRAKRFYFSWCQLCLYAAIPVAYFAHRPTHDVLAALVTLSFVGHLVGIFRPSSRLLGEVFSRGSGAAPVVALTFDDGPEPAATPAVLDLLAREGVRATFFAVGERALAHPALARRIAAEGHEVGNHTLGHRWLLATYLVPPGSVRREIEEGAAILARLTGREPRLLRPPVGFKNLFVTAHAESRGMVVATFSLRSGDTRRRASAQAIARRVLSRVSPGSIVLFHDGGRDAGAGRRLVTALNEIVPALRARGYGFATVGELYAAASQAGPE